MKYHERLGFSIASVDEKIITARHPQFRPAAWLTCAAAWTYDPYGEPARMTRVDDLRHLPRSRRFDADPLAKKYLPHTWTRLAVLAIEAAAFEELRDTVPDATPAVYCYKSRSECQVGVLSPEDIGYPSEVEGLDAYQHAIRVGYKWGQFGLGVWSEHQLYTLPAPYLLARGALSTKVGIGPIDLPLGVNFS